MYAKKSLGQHFLNSPSALSAIVETGQITKDDTILEVGPGTGTLTNELISRAKKIIAIEADHILVTQLHERFATAIQEGKLNIIEGDILEVDINILFAKKESYKVIANIPYYITGAIIKKFLSAQFQPKQMVLLIQKEVAERIIAKDNKESILSLSVKVYGEARYVQTVKSGAFNPPPKVDSAIISIENISRNNFTDISEELFFSLIKKGFSSKRKMLKNNIGADFATFEVCGINKKARAEDLTLSQWLCLAAHTS